MPFEASANELRQTANCGKSEKMGHNPRILSSARAERLRRQVERKRSDKQKFVLQLCGIGVLMVGAVVADYLFIQWGRYVRHHRQSVTNSVAGTNSAVAR